MIFESGLVGIKVVVKDNASVEDRFVRELPTAPRSRIHIQPEETSDDRKVLFNRRNALIRFEVILFYF